MLFDILLCAKTGKQSMAGASERFVREINLHVVLCLARQQWRFLSVHVCRIVSQLGNKTNTFELREETSLFMQPKRR